MKVWLVAGRILLALIAVAIPAAVVRLGVIPGLEAVFNLTENVASTLRRISMVMAISAGYWMYVRTSEKRPATELSFKPITILASGFAGCASIAVPMAVLYVMGIYSVTSFGGHYALASIALVIFAAAFLEEIVFRGVLFGIVERSFGKWVALFVPSVLFSALHFFNDHWVGWFGFVSVLLLGIMWSMVYLLTRNLWAAAANHAAWNFTIFSTGLPLTGQQEWRAIAPVQSEYGGSKMWTGGSAGPENSLIVIICIAVIIGLLFVIEQNRRPH